MKFGFGTVNKNWQKVLSALYLIKFLLNKVENRTALLVEANNCHTELFPSYVKYLKDLGYNVEIAASVNQKGFLPKFSGVKKTYFLMLKSMRILFQTKKMRNYELVILTSYRLYYPRPNELQPLLYPYSTADKHFEIKYPPKLGVLFILHHLEDYNETIKNAPCAVVLSDILKKEKNLYTINPCYFKENAPKDKIEYTQTFLKNIAKKTVFITTGVLDAERKNADLLFSSARMLIQDGIKNFEIKVIGDNKKNIIPADLKNYIKIKGRLDFKHLYKELETSDFYLPLLDPNLKEHKRYLENGTSGSFQLIRGFLLPPIIHKAFAAAYKFNALNSLIYDNNKEMHKVMKSAVNMNNDKYLELQAELLNSRKEIIKSSLNTLQTLFEMLEEKKS